MHMNYNPESILFDSKCRQGHGLFVGSGYKNHEEQKSILNSQCHQSIAK